MVHYGTQEAMYCQLLHVCIPVCAVGHKSADRKGMHSQYTTGASLLAHFLSKYLIQPFKRLSCSLSSIVFTRNTEQVVNYQNSLLHCANVYINLTCKNDVALHTKHFVHQS